MFFSESREHYFKPLTGKYREAVVECLRLLYMRFYTDLRGYGHAFNREQLIDIFQEAVARAPILDADQEEAEGEGRFKSQRELAGFILNRLLEYGWLERNFDEATLKSTYGFSRVGRLFTQPFVDMGSERIITRHRNTRNTRNSLQAFVEKGEIHDLLDAYQYSERIISDFTDVIAELEERKRELVREVESQQLIQKASDQFFDFMEKRFQPDVSVRLSADSVEKYRDEINALLGKIRRKRKEFKLEAEQRLRQQIPAMVQGKQSLLYALLDAIELRLKNASEIMLPALRKALNSFTQRADIIIRQLSYITAQQQDDAVDLCQRLAQVPENKQDGIIQNTGHAMSAMALRFIDPAHIRLQAQREKRVVLNRVSQGGVLDTEARKALYIQQVLDQAFSVTDQGMRQYMVEVLQETGRVSSADLPIENAQDLLAMTHAIEVGAASNLSSEFYFTVTPSGRRIQNPYLHGADEFIIELVGNTEQHESN